MDWQTTNNSEDCGIFLMRHMETYKGDKKNWETRLKEETIRKLTYVSISYIVALFFNLKLCHINITLIFLYFQFQYVQYAQLVKLRVKYNNAILSSKINEKREAIIKEGLYLYNEAAANKVLNLVIESSQSSQGEPKGADNNQPEKKKTVTFAKNLTSTFAEGN